MILEKSSTYQKLVDQLVSERTLATKEITKAFYKIDRSNFFPEDNKNQAGINIAFPIGFDQTISQPFTVAFMLELLQPKAGHKILDIGSGSGWQAALLAEIVGGRGRVIGLEIIPELQKLGSKNLQKFAFKNIEIFNQDGSKGLLKEAPFDRIIGAAAIPKIPPSLKKQLKINGRLVMPVGKDEQELVLIIRKGEDDYIEEKFPGFVFVPMIGNG